MLVGYSFSFSGGNSYNGDATFIAMRGLGSGADQAILPNQNVPHAAYIFFEMQFAFVHCMLFAFSPL